MARDARGARSASWPTSARRPTCRLRPLGSRRRASRAWKVLPRLCSREGDRRTPSRDVRRRVPEPVPATWFRESARDPPPGPLRDGALRGAVVASVLRCRIEGLASGAVASPALGPGGRPRGGAAPSAAPRGRARPRRARPTVSSSSSAAARRRWRPRAGGAPRARWPPTTARRGAAGMLDEPIAAGAAARRCRAPVRPASGLTRAEARDAPSTLVTPMSLARLDLRGVPAADMPRRRCRAPSRRRRLSRPRRCGRSSTRSARGGDAAVRELTAPLRRRDASTPCGSRPRSSRPPSTSLDRHAAPRARGSPTSASSPTTATSRAAASGDFGATGSPCGTSCGRSTGPGCTRPGGRARYPSTVLMCGAGPGGRRRRAGAVRAARARRRGRAETLAAAAIAGVDEVYRDRRRPGDRGHGLRHRDDPARSTSSSAPATATWPTPSAQVAGGRSACPRPSPGRPRWSWSPTTPTPVELGRHRPRGAGRARPRRPGLAGDLVGGRWPTPSTAEVDRLVAASPAPGRDRGHPAAAATRCWCDGPDAGHGGGQRGRPRAPRAHDRRPRGAAAAGAQRRARCSRPLRPGERRRLPGRPQPRAAHRPLGPLRLGARGSTTSASTSTSSSLDADGPGRASRRTSWPSPRPRGCPPTPSRCGCGADERARVTARRPARAPTSASRTGYHSPQVDVEVRLNTNESPLPPPAASGSRRCRPSSATSSFNRYPDRGAVGAARAPWPSCTASARAGLLRQRLQRGAAEPAARLRRRRAARWRCSSRPTPCTATSPRSPAPRWSSGWRRPDHRLDLDVGRPTCSSEAQPDHHLPVLAQQPHRAAPSRPTVVAHVLDARARAWWWSTRPTGSSPPGRRSSCWRDDAAPSAWWWCAPSPRRGRWRPPGSATWSADPAVVAALERVALPYHLDALKQAAGRLALRYVGAMEARVALVTEERGRLAAALADLAVERGRRTPTSSSSGPRHRRAAEVWQGLVDRVGAGARLLDAGPASTTACGSRSARPRRTTGSSPPSQEVLGVTTEPARPGAAPNAASEPPARPRSTSTVDPRRQRARSRCPPGCRSSTTCSPSSAATAGSTSRVQADRRPRGRRPPHRRGRRHRARRGLREALGDKAGVRRFASIAVPLDEALVEVALDLSGRPFLVYDVDRSRPTAPPLGVAAVRPAAGRGVLAGLRRPRPAITLHVRLRQRARTPTTSSRRRSRGWPAALRDAVRVEGGGVPSTKGVLASGGGAGP